MRHLLPTQVTLLIAALLTTMTAWTTPLRAADTERLNAFLEVTGFDVALESIRLGADSAPQMLGMQAEDFGSAWQRLVREVFAPALVARVLKSSNV